MSFVGLLLLSCALAMDALIVCFSYGLVIRYHRGRAGLSLALATGLGQFLLPVAGFYLTVLIAPYVSSCDHWVSAGVFFLLGTKIIYDACHPEGADGLKIQKLTVKTLAIIALATSIDAFVAGSSLYLAGASLWMSASLIGGLTFLLSLLGFHLTRILHHLPTHWLEILAGLMLIGVGIKILVEHLSSSVNYCF